MSKQYRVIDAAMSVSEALSVLSQHDMYAEFYRVSQGDDLELAEATRLLSGLGCVIKQNETDFVVGRFERLKNIDGNTTIESTPRIGMSYFGESTVFSDNIIKVHFPENNKNKFSFTDAIKDW